MNLDALRELDLPPIEHVYTKRDTMLYALGLGFGADPLDARQLQFVFEEGLRALPSMSVVLAHPGFWIRRPEFGVDWLRLLHGEQSFEVHRPLPPEGAVRGVYKISAIEDRGKDRGAALFQDKELFDVATGDHLATVRSTVILRGDGGQGGFGDAPAQPEPLPPGAPDRVVDIPTLPQSALIYRLSGDYNPIHADPGSAKKAGFERPILHGLCTMGIACRGLIEAVDADEPERLSAMSVRFSRPVFPGETIRVEIFGDGAEVAFRARVLERDVIVLDRGRARFAAPIARERRASA